MPTIEYYEQQITNANDKDELDRILDKMRKENNYEDFFTRLSNTIHDKNMSLITNYKTGNDTFGHESPHKGGKRKRKTLKRKRSKKTKNNKKSRKSKRKMTRRRR
jgi:hypothetical protein